MASYTLKTIIKPCPFCGEVPDISKHFKEEMWRMTHGCAVMGPLTIDWRDSIASVLKTWNHRAGETTAQKWAFDLHSTNGMISIWGSRVGKVWITPELMRDDQALQEILRKIAPEALLAIDKARGSSTLKETIERLAECRAVLE